MTRPKDTHRRTTADFVTRAYIASYVYAANKHIHPPIIYKYTYIYIRIKLVIYHPRLYICICIYVDIIACNYYIRTVCRLLWILCGQLRAPATHHVEVAEIDLCRLNGLDGGAAQLVGRKFAATFQRRQLQQEIMLAS